MAVSYQWFYEENYKKHHLLSNDKKLTSVSFLFLFRITNCKYEDQNSVNLIRMRFSRFRKIGNTDTISGGEYTICGWGSLV